MEWNDEKFHPCHAHSSFIAALNHSALKSCIAASHGLPFSIVTQQQCCLVLAS